ncbi:hypothetical protein F4821DRAFT_235181 [Hypoxylon rubiginosum]|uniref:Uncharacterized protein n=1 Tax=Hypoxylon rubiginosum TaxID=110542 RepID=A0ACC0D5D4_9PEZI|nr:hypothetical protein F4821DRAFT_235181 [Hypoxylon rubiginosum]
MSSLTELAAVMPRCSLLCLQSAVMNSTCAPTDQSCICGDQALNNQTSSCISVACTVRESLTSLNVTNHLCGIAPTTDYSFIPILIVFLILAGVVVIMRIMTRILMHMPFWWDDWANFAAMLCCIAYTAYCIKMKDLGYGIDLWAVPQDNITDSFVGFYATAELYVVARWLIRTSIVLFYARIFRSSRAERLMWGSLIGSVLITFPFLLVITFQCNPVSSVWLSWDGEHPGKCIDKKKLIWVGFVLLLLNDFWLMAIPLPFVANLQLSLRKKILASAMFCMGIIVTVISIYKLTLISEYTQGTNPTLQIVPMGIWAGIEIDLGVVCACMPSMPMLFRPLVHRFKSSSAGNSVPTGHTGSSSQYSNQNRKRRFLPTTSQSSSILRSGSNIRMVTTIRQTNEPSGSDAQLPLCEPSGIELGRINHGNTNAQAWS